jgi:hypothetical protein
VKGSRAALSRSSIGAAAGVAVCGLLATSLAFVLHEAVGHGLAAYALGGRFLGFFVSPTAAFAETAISDAGRPWILAAGTPVSVITGLVAYAVLKRHQNIASLAGIALWQFAHISLVFQLLYAGGLPLGMWLSGQAPQGDWSLLFAQVGIHPLASAAVLLPLSVIAAAALARLSERLTSWPRVVQRRWGIVAAYVTLAAPPLMLAVVYALVTLPWSEARDHFELMGIVATPLTAGLAGAVVAQYRRGDVTSQPSGAQTRPTAPGAISATAVLLMSAVLFGVGWLFGPTTSLRRGVAVQRPVSDDYFRAAHDVRVKVAFKEPGRAELFVSSEPVATRGSPYVRRLSQNLAALGPSIHAAAEFTQFLAERNLGFGKITVSDAPRRVDEGWYWSAMTDVGSSHIRVQIWPAIYNAHARVVEVTLAGVAHRSDAPPVEGMTTSNETIVWKRPASFVAPVQFDAGTPMRGR